MKIQDSAFFSVLLFFIVSQLSADTIKLKDGKTIQGQILKISESSIIIEVMTDMTYAVSTISIPRAQVKNIIDESNVKLYEDSLLLVSDLSAFYERENPFGKIIRAERDTLIAENGQVIIGNINGISASNVTFTKEDRQSKLYTVNLEKIISINGQDMNMIRNEYKRQQPPPVEKVLSYPRIGIEIGLSGVVNQLSQYRNIFDDLSKELDLNSYQSPHAINNPFFAINLGFIVKISQHVSLAANSLFTINFGDNEDYYEDIESYRLFFAEIQYLYPLKSFSPWIGLGYAFQSLTIINRYSEVDVKYKSQANSIFFAAGFDLDINSQVNFVFALRYFPFGEKEIGINNREEINAGYSLNLSNLMISAGIVINL